MAVKAALNKKAIGQQEAEGFFALVSQPRTGQGTSTGKGVASTARGGATNDRADGRRLLAELFGSSESV